jgi:hypothetical protein
MYLTKYMANGPYMVFVSDPPIREPEVFIQPGGLHGVAMIVSWGLSCSACRTSGMMSA